MRCFFQKFLVFFSIFLSFILMSPLSFAQSAETVKKQGGIYGDPSRKRGMEYGFDKGYSAGKEDQKKNLEPDPKRHEAFKDPNVYYRYEFGSRASFNAGFRSGFSGGYQKAFGKEVTQEKDTVGAGMTVSEETQGTPASKKNINASTSTTPKVPNASSDAL